MGPYRQRRIEESNPTAMQTATWLATKLTPMGHILQKVPGVHLPEPVGVRGIEPPSIATGLQPAGLTTCPTHH